MIFHRAFNRLHNGCRTCLMH